MTFSVLQCLKMMQIFRYGQPDELRDAKDPKDKQMVSQNKPAGAKWVITFESRKQILASLKVYCTSK